VELQLPVLLPGVDAGHVPGVAAAARDYGELPRVSVQEAAFVPEHGDVPQVLAHVGGHLRHALVDLGNVLQAGQVQHRQRQLEAAAGAALDARDVAEDRGGEVH